MEHSEEILNVNWLEISSPSWTRSVFSHDQAIKWTKAKVFLCADSVQCLGQMNDSKEAIARWKDSRCILLTKMQWESMEMQLNSSDIFSQNCRHKRSKNIWRERTLNPKSSRTGSSSCQCSMTLIGQKKELYLACRNGQRIRDEILAKTLDISRSSVGREVVWEIFLFSKRRLGFHSQQNGTAIPRNRSPCVQNHHCSESRNQKEKEG